MLLSFAVLTLFFQLFPPPEQPKKPAPAAGAEADGKQADEEKVADANAAAMAETTSVRSSRHASRRRHAAGPVELADVAADAECRRNSSRSDRSIRTDGYRMLVTLTNAGRPFIAPRWPARGYVDQHDRSGYLGELELKDVPDGVAVASRRPRHASG